MIRKASRSAASANLRARSGSTVATDSDIGRVQGRVVDFEDRSVTHVLLAAGHLWGKKEVVIPISAVVEVAAGVRLNLSRDQVKDLRPVDIGEFG